MQITRPFFEKYNTILFYGARGSAKSYWQAQTCLKIFKFLEKTYAKNPDLHKAIIFSVQRFNKKIEDKNLGKFLYYWNDAKDLRYCPRENCWKGQETHRLHNAFVIIDDMATILAADDWANTPKWMRKTFTQGRHFGIHVIANCQDPFGIDINFRRTIDVAYRFSKILSSREPDETRPKVKWIFGIFKTYRIRWEDLKHLKEDIPEDVIKTQKRINKNKWIANYHIITAKSVNIYDTTQDVPEYLPQGYEHITYRCIDPAHPECGFKKEIHNLV